MKSNPKPRLRFVSQDVLKPLARAVYREDSGSLHFLLCFQCFHCLFFRHSQSYPYADAETSGKTPTLFSLQWSSVLRERLCARGLGLFLLGKG